MLWLCKQAGNANLCQRCKPKELFLSDATLFILRFVIFAAVHSLFATQRVKQIFSGENHREPRFYRLIYNMVSVALIIWVMGAYRSSPVLYFAPGSWSLVMYAAQLVVVGLLAVCLRQTGVGDFLGLLQARSTSPASSKLITEGCYARMRHPLYFYSLLFMILNPVMTIQWLLLTVLSLVYFITGAIIEERRLAKIFGKTYRDYQQRVSFILPIRKKSGKPGKD